VIPDTRPQRELRPQVAIRQMIEREQGDG
jgi:hypothetical protein